MVSLSDLQALHLTEEQFKVLPREEQERYLWLLDQELQLRKSQKILFYKANPKLEQFHLSTSPIRAIFGGNRSGKTTAGGMEFLFHITGMYPDWYPKEQRYAYPIKGRIIATDYQKGVGEVIIPFLEEWMDPSLVQKKIRQPATGIGTKWILKNGSVFDILTYEQDVTSFEGWKGQIAWFDEPPPRDKYIATLRGLVDYKGRAWMTLTPLNQPWIYDEIFAKNDKRIFVVTTDMRDNPHLSPEAIKDFEANLTEEEKEARMHGRFMHLTGLVYKEFSADINICDPPTIKPTWTRYMAIDPHERMPTAVLWLAVDNEGNHWIYDELWLKDMDVEQIAHAIHVQEGELLPRIRLIDPHNDKDNAIAGGFNIRKELMKYGVYCERANSDPQLGKSRIRQALKPKYSPMLKHEVPQLRVSRECKQTIYEFQHYVWDEFRRNKDEQGAKDQVKKKNDHLMDCLRYIYNWGPRYIVTEQQEEESVRYVGDYTKYPTQTPASGSYHALIEGKAGNF